MDFSTGPEVPSDDVSTSESSTKGVHAPRFDVKTDASRELGKALAEKAKAAGVTAVVFDRGGYLYHGRVKAFAEGAREGGLAF